MRGGGKARLRHDETAGGILVEAVHEARASPCASRRASSIPSTWRVVPEPPCTARPIGLLRTRTSLSSYRVIARGCRRRPGPCAAVRATGRCASSLSGGMRTFWPASRRSLALARWPSMRSSPLRTMRWTCVNGSLREARDEEAVDAHLRLVRLDDENLHARGKRFLRGGADLGASRLRRPARRRAGCCCARARGCAAWAQAVPASLRPWRRLDRPALFRASEPCR